MHEWALAEAVVTTAVKEGEKAKLKKITKIKVVIGELQQIDKELFKSLLQDIIHLEDSKVREAKVEVEFEEAVLKCRVCGHELSFSKSRKKLSSEEAEMIHFIPEMAHVYLRCPKCGSPDFEVEKGRGVWIESIEGEKEDGNDGCKIGSN